MMWTAVGPAPASAEKLPFSTKKFSVVAAPALTGQASTSAVAPVSEVTKDDGTLVPDYGAGVGNGPQTLSAYLQRYIVSTSSGWVNVRGAKSSFTVGLGKNGWPFDVATQKAGTDSNWYFGYMMGGTSTGGTYGGSTVERCLWIGTPWIDVSTQPTQSSDCTTVPDLVESAFMYAFNDNIPPGSPDANCGFKTQRDGSQRYSCDGTPTYIDPAKCPGGAPVMGNVQPWRPLLGLWGDYLYTIPANQWVKWRYISKDLQFTMMRDAYRDTWPRPAGTPAQDWGFIPTRCISYWGSHVVGPRPAGGVD